MKEAIPVFKPLIRESEIQAATRSLEEGWLGMGKSVGAFEEAITDRLGLDGERHAVAVSTGHAALHLGFLLAGLGPGDEVITPSFNNIADFQAILATGAQPVFCDIDEATLCLDLEQAESLIGPKTKAIIAMDYDCCMCDHAGVAALAERHGLRVMHDAAHSIGSFCQGKAVGTFSDLCMFSFDPVKTITCIDGGMLIVRTEEEVEQLHRLRLIGMGQPSKVMYQNTRAWTYDVSTVGFRYHMANLHAAVGLAQLEQFDEISSTRKETCRQYNERLSQVDGVRVPLAEHHFDDVTPFLYYIRVPADHRDALRTYLSEHGVDTGIHWQPGHWFNLLKDMRRGDLSVTDRIADEILSLPLHSMMDPDDQERVIAGVEGYFQQQAKGLAS